MTSRADLLSAYDAQLRVAGELARADRVQEFGPLYWAEFDDGWGFVTYTDLGGLEGDELDATITATVAHFRDETAIERFEWKTRGHDAPADLHERLRAHGFEAEPEETVMIGEAALLADAVPPAGVTICRAGDGGDLTADVRRARMLQDEVFGRSGGTTFETAVAEYRDRPDETQLWFAQAGADVVAAGRLVLVPGTEFAGLWGGATLAAWRGRGIYRALTAARAREALRLGIRYLQVDCTPMSRPILERSGLVPVTTTTPYVWTRASRSLTPP